nr:TetR/AcrR family transcriptional regulator [uncultured Cohaesibacter sp.]
MEHSTYQKLMIAAADLLRQKGYAATGISDILGQANVTRGSLYHHFPGGKSDLAVAAARYSCSQLVKHIETACEVARANGGDFHDAMVALCRRIYQLFQEHGNWRFMTVSATLQEGGERNAFFCNEARALYARLKSKAIEEGATFGWPERDSFMALRKALLIVEGGWMLARVVDDPTLIRSSVQFMEEEKQVYRYRKQLGLSCPAFGPEIDPLF